MLKAIAVMVMLGVLGVILLAATATITSAVKLAKEKKLKINKKHVAGVVAGLWVGGLAMSGAFDFSPDAATAQETVPEGPVPCAQAIEEPTNANCRAYEASLASHDDGMVHGMVKTDEGRRLNSDSPSLSNEELQDLYETTGDDSFLDGVQCEPKIMAEDGSCVDPSFYEEHVEDAAPLTQPEVKNPEDTRPELPERVKPDTTPGKEVTETTTVTETYTKTTTTTTKG